MVTLVLLPGMDGTGELFEPFVAVLGKDLRVKVVSYPTTSPLGYPELESMVAAALPQEGPFMILGESFSGPIAVSLAASCSPQLKGLILCCSFVRNPRPLLSGLRPFLGLLPYSIVPTRLLDRLLLGRFSTRALRSSLASTVARVAPFVLRARVRAVLSVNVSARLGEVRAPVLYLRASQDRVVPSANSRLVAELCPQARIVTLRAPHLLLQAVPSEAARAIETFVHEVENAP